VFGDLQALKPPWRRNFFSRCQPPIRSLQPSSFSTEKVIFAKSVDPALTLRDSGNDANDFKWESFLSEHGCDQGQLADANYAFNVGELDEPARDEENGNQE
jgi:hypothetical protein